MAAQVAPQVVGTTTGRWSVDTETQQSIGRSHRRGTTPVVHYVDGAAPSEPSLPPREYQQRMINTGRRMGRTNFNWGEVANQAIDRLVNPPVRMTRPTWGRVQVPSVAQSPEVVDWCALTTEIVNAGLATTQLEQAYQDMMMYGRATIPVPEVFHGDSDRMYSRLHQASRYSREMAQHESCVIDHDDLIVMLTQHRAFRGMGVIPGETGTYIGALSRVFECTATLNQRVAPGYIRITFMGDRRGRNER